MDTILRLTGGDSEKAVSLLEWIAKLAQGESAKAVREIVATAASKGWSEGTILTALEAVTGKRPALAQRPTKKPGFFQRGPQQDANSLWQNEEGI